MDNKKIGKFISDQRKKKGLTQRELAESLCVLPQTVSKWETGHGIPDLTQLEKLKEIFNCSIDDILSANYAFDKTSEDCNDSSVYDTEIVGNIIIDNNNDVSESVDIMQNSDTDNQTDVCEKINQLRDMYPIIVDFDKTQDESKKTSFKDFFSRRKNKKSKTDNPKRPLKERLHNLFSKKTLNDTFSNFFGVPYNVVKNSKVENVLKRDKKKRHSREEFENVITQGMFRSSENRNYIGITKPWACYRFFFYLLLLFALSLILSIASKHEIFAIITGSCLFVLPLLLMVFEYNYPRNINILQVIFMFFVGGFMSLIFTFIFNSISPTASIFTAPFVEEIAKFITVAIFIYRYKPRYILSGMLIGFAIGAGFDIFETISYGYNFSLLYFVNPEEFGSGILVVCARTISTLYIGHHYFAMLYAGIMTSVVKDEKPHVSQIFNYKVALAVIVSMLLHLSWNAHTLITNYVVLLIVEIIIGICNIAIFVIMLKIAVAQYRISYMCYCMKNDY